MRNIYESTILLVDDNGQLRELVCGLLRREGFLHADTAASIKETEQYLQNRKPDLLVLDINLPDGDGFSLMQKIRAESDVPVLFLSARDADADRLLGLGLGADDYMVKPFLPKELVLRVSAILKRTYFPFGGKEITMQEIVLGGCKVDFASGTACQGQREVSLTAKELAILKKLAENRGKIVTFDQLCQAVWGDSYYGYENTVMVHVRRLREKIEEDPSKPKWLMTVRGLGYKLK